MKTFMLSKQTGLALLLLLGLLNGLGMVLETQAAPGPHPSSLIPHPFQATAPEIVLLAGTTDVPDNTGRVNFGATPLGTPVTKTLTIRNTGNEPLLLTSPITLTGSGFTLVHSYGQSTLTGGTSTTFTLRLEATASGAFSGTVQFENNDADENPFNFSVEGRVGQFSVYLPITLKSPPAGLWNSQSSGTTQTLQDISCPTLTICFAVGEGGLILATGNGGDDWSDLDSGTTNTLNSISCATETTCVAVGTNGLILRTTNGGDEWISRSSGTGQVLRGVSCPTLNICFAVGGTDQSVGLLSDDGGNTWDLLPDLGNTTLWSVSCPNEGTCTTVGDFGRIMVFAGVGIKRTLTLGPYFKDVSCGSETSCVAVADEGKIMATTNGGNNWVSQNSGTANTLNGVSCPNQATCFAVGAAGTIRATSSGGSTWVGEMSNTGSTLLDISCPGLATCYAVGEGGTILAKK